MSLKDKKKWNAKYDGDSYIAGKEPCVWLKTHSGLLTEGGKALDIAAGEGRNSVFTATLGFEVVSMDISEVALAKAQRLGQSRKMMVKSK